MFKSQRRRICPRAAALQFACFVTLVTAIHGRSVAQDGKPAAAEAGLQYPLTVAVAPDSSYVIVDLNLPGVWRLPAEGGEPSLIVQGSKMFRKPLNRPRSVVVGKDGTIYVGDTATREIYKVAADGANDPVPLTEGYLGIPNSLSLTSDDQLIIADLESHMVYRVPVSGGQPEIYSKTNARGVYVDENGRVLAVLAPAGPPQLVEVVPDGDDKPIVNEMAFQFPHNVVAGKDGTLYVTDGYAKAVWKVVTGMPPEKLVEGEPLKNPVGLAINDAGNLVVVDSHAKQIFEINPATAEIKALVK